MNVGLILGIGIAIGAVAIIIYLNIKTRRAKKAPKLGTQDYLKQNNRNL